MGSSVTVQKEGYRVFLHQWFQEYFKQPHQEINASIGGVGGMTGVFTMDEDVIPYQPDLCFIEYMVSDRIDRYTPEHQIGQVIEGIVRKLKKINCQIVFIYRYIEAKHIDSRFIKAYYIHENIADAYQISSINICYYIQELIDSQKVDPKELFSDRTHTQPEGGKIIARAISDAVLKTLETDRKTVECNNHLISPIYKDNYENTQIIYINENLISDKENYQVEGCTSRIKNTVGEFKNHQYFSIDSSNQVQFTLKGELLGIMVIVGKDSGFIELTTPDEKYEYLLWDQWCHYNRFTTIVTNQYYSDFTEIILRVTDKEVDYSKCRRKIENPETIIKKLNIVGLMVRDYELAQPQLEASELVSSFKDQKTMQNIDFKSFANIQKTADEYKNSQNWNRAIEYYQKIILSGIEKPGIYLKIAQCLQAKNLNNEAIAMYQRALQLKPQTSSGIYKSLGDCFVANQQINQAISCYYKIMEEEKNISAGFYVNLGNILLEQNRLDEALRIYDFAVKKNENLGEEFYLKLKYIQEKNSQLEAAKITYKKWLEKYYLVNHKYKLVYCPIPKNACTFFKTLMVELSDECTDFKNSSYDIHKYIRATQSKIKLTSFSYIENQNYLKLVILRNPFERLVSAYLNKFVRINKKTPIVQKVIDDVYNNFDLKREKDSSITFSQFIDYLSRTEDYDLNEHWRPQHTFLGTNLVEFDLVFQLENLDSALEKLETQLGIKIDNKKTKNRTKYVLINSDDHFYDKYPQELQAYSGLPKAAKFYTPELENLVRVRYARDIEIYENKFNVKLGRY